MYIIWEFIWITHIIVTRIQGTFPTVLCNKFCDFAKFRVSFQLDDFVFKVGVSFACQENQKRQFFIKTLGFNFGCRKNPVPFFASWFMGHSNGNLWDAFGCPETVAFVGGGGKTTLSFQILNEGAVAGRKALFTTTTKVRVPEIPHQIDVLVETTVLEEAVRLVGQAFEQGHQRVGLVTGRENSSHGLRAVGIPLCGSNFCVPMLQISALLRRMVPECCLSRLRVQQNPSYQRPYQRLQQLLQWLASMLWVSHWMKITFVGLRLWSKWHRPPTRSHMSHHVLLGKSWAIETCGVISSPIQCRTTLWWTRLWNLGNGVKIGIVKRGSNERPQVHLQFLDAYQRSNSKTYLFKRSS